MNRTLHRVLGSTNTAWGWGATVGLHSVRMIYYLVWRVLVSSALFCLDIARDRVARWRQLRDHCDNCHVSASPDQDIFSLVHIQTISRYTALPRWCPRSVEGKQKYWTCVRVAFHLDDQIFASKCVSRPGVRRLDSKYPHRSGRVFSSVVLEQSSILSVVRVRSAGGRWAAVAASCCRGH